MTFEQFIIPTPAGDARIRWADFITSDAWFCKLQELTSPDNLARLDRAGWPAQYRALRDALTAASNAYRALTLPPDADTRYALVWHDTFLSRAAVDRANDALTRMGEDGLRHIAAEYVPPTLGGGPSSGQFVVQPWAWLDGDALPRQWDTFANGDSSNPRRDYDGPGTGCGREGSLDQGCDPFSWDVISWSGPVLIARGYTVLAPPRWTMEALQRIAIAGVERGARGVLNEATAAVSLRNLALLQRWGVGSVTDLAALARVGDLEAWRPGQEPGVQGLQLGLRIAAAALTAAGAATAGAGAVAGAILGIASGIIEAVTGTVDDVAPTGAEAARRMLLVGYLPGTAPEGGRLVRSPGDVPMPSDPRRCMPLAIPGPRVLAQMVPDDPANPAGTGTLRLLLTDTTAYDPGRSSGGWREARYQIIDALRNVRESPAEFPSSRGDFAGLNAGQSYLVRARVTMASGTTAYTPVVVTAALVAAPEFNAAEALTLIGLTCDRWLALNRADQLTQVRRLPDVTNGRREAGATVTLLTTHCVRMVGERGADIAPPPGPIIIPVDTRTPAQIGRDLLTRAAMTCAQWTAASPSDRIAALDRAGIASDESSRSRSADAIAAACLAERPLPVAVPRPTSPDDGPGWLAYLRRSCAQWVTLAPASRVAELQENGVTSTDELARVTTAIDAVCVSSEPPPSPTPTPSPTETPSEEPGLSAPVKLGLFAAGVYGVGKLLGRW